MFIPRSEGVQEEIEFKKSSRWSTTLGLRHVYLPVCGRKSQLTSSRHIVVCILAKNLILLYICTCVFLIHDISEYVYHSECDKKFSVQLDAYLVQRKYILRIWRHHDEPSHNYKMAARAPSWSTTLGLRHVSYNEERRSSRRTQHDPLS